MNKIISKLTSQSGATIAEAILASVIIVTMISVGIVFNEPLKYQIKQVSNRYDAVNLALSQYEDLKVLSEEDWFATDIVDTAGAWHASTANIFIPEGYTVEYQILDKMDWAEDDVAPTDVEADYKEVTVRCVYPVYKTTGKGSVTIKAFVSDDRVF